MFRHVRRFIRDHAAERGPARPAHRHSRRARPGFTLLETSLALIIIGVGVLAFVEAQKTFIANNKWSSHTAKAMYLANEVREMCRRLPRHDPVTGLSMAEGADGDDVLSGWGFEDGETSPADFDDVDDLDGIRFGIDGDFPGPINSYGEIVSETDLAGEELLDEEGNPVSLVGWSQEVTVEKVDPFNYSTVREPAYSEAPEGDFPGRTVDRYPLRVTVVVEFQGPDDLDSQEVARVTWIVP